MTKYRHSSGRVLRTRFWLLGWWGQLFAPTDMGDLWTTAKVRPFWFWWWRRLCLFVSIVWRRYEVQRLDWRTSWAVSHVALGVRVWRVGNKGKPIPPDLKVRETP